MQTSQDPPAVLRNPFLDGLDGVTRSQRQGVSSLTIQRGSKPTAKPANPGASLVVAPPAVSPTYAAQLALGQTLSVFG